MAEETRYNGYNKNNSNCSGYVNQGCTGESDERYEDKGGAAVRDIVSAPMKAHIKEGASEAWVSLKRGPVSSDQGSM